VAQASSCMCAGKGRTLRAFVVENNTAVSFQPYDNINVSFFQKCFPVVICNKFELLTFPR